MVGSSESELSAAISRIWGKSGLDRFDGSEVFLCREGTVGGRGASEREDRRVNFEARAISAVVRLGRGVDGRPLHNWMYIHVDYYYKD